MPRYIDADNIVDSLNEAQNEFDIFYKGLGKAKSIVMEQPTADAAPVRHAHWMGGGGLCSPYCSNCKKYSPSGVRFDYCPYCGAKMDEEVGKDGIR